MWSYNYTFQYSYYLTLAHHGIKGQKWGVKNGPPYPLKSGENKVENSEKSGIIKLRVSGHFSTPKRTAPNSVIDHIDENGKVDTRTYYDKTGLIEKEIHTTDHGNPKNHQYGEHGEHAHDFIWGESEKYKDRTTRDLNSRERSENSDIL